MTEEFHLDNRAKKIGKRGPYDWYNWELFLNEPPDRLNEIKRVTYQLHPTFPNPIRVQEDKDAKFAIQSSGWGEFEIAARIELQDGREVLQKYWLKLGENPWPMFMETIDQVRPAVGTTLFGTNPLEGEAILIQYLGGGIELEFHVGQRTETATLLRDGSLHQTLAEVGPGAEVPLPLVRSSKVEGTRSRIFIRVQPTAAGQPARPQGPPLELGYVGPRPKGVPGE